MVPIMDLFLHVPLSHTLQLLSVLFTSSVIVPLRRLPCVAAGYSIIISRGKANLLFRSCFGRGRSGGEEKEHVCMCECIHVCIYI